MDTKIRNKFIQGQAQKKKRLYKELMQRDKTVYKLSKKKSLINEKKFDFIDEEKEILRRDQFVNQRQFLSDTLNGNSQGMGLMHRS